MDQPREEPGGDCRLRRRYRHFFERPAFALTLIAQLALLWLGLFFRLTRFHREDHGARRQNEASGDRHMLRRHAGFRRQAQPPRRRL